MYINRFLSSVEMVQSSRKRQEILSPRVHELIRGESGCSDDQTCRIGVNLYTSCIPEVARFYGCFLKKSPFRIIPASKSLEKFPGWCPLLKGPFRKISLLALSSQLNRTHLAVGWRPHLHIASSKVMNGSWLAGSNGFSLLRWLVKGMWKMWGPTSLQGKYISFLKMPWGCSNHNIFLGVYVWGIVPFPVIDNPEEYFGMFRWEGSIP